MCPNLRLEVTQRHCRLCTCASDQVSRNLQRRKREKRLAVGSCGLMCLDPLRVDVSYVCQTVCIISSTHCSL